MCSHRHVVNEVPVHRHVGSDASGHRHVCGIIFVPGKMHPCGHRLVWSQGCVWSLRCLVTGMCAVIGVPGHRHEWGH